MLKILIAEDHAVMRATIHRLLADEHGIEIVGEVSDGAAAVALAEIVRPDVVVMDFAMPVLNGVDAAHHIRRAAPDIRTVILTGHAIPLILPSAVHAGVSAVIGKDRLFDDLVPTIHAIGRIRTITTRDFDERRRLAILRSYVVAESGPESRCQDIVSAAASLTRRPISLITLLDDQRQWFKARHGLDMVGTPRAYAFCAYAIMGPDEVMVVPDARLDRRFADNPLVTGLPSIRFYAATPLIAPEGAALGTLCVIDRKPGELEADDRATLVALGKMALVALEAYRR